MTLRQRLKEEANELEIKLLRLHQFVLSDKWNEISQAERDLLRQQDEYMSCYWSVLTNRIDRFHQ